MLDCRVSLVSLCRLQAALIDQLAVGIVITDWRRRVVSYNRAAHEMLSECGLMGTLDAMLRETSANGHRSIAAAIDVALHHPTSDLTDAVGYFQVDLPPQGPALRGYAIRLVGVAGGSETRQADGAAIFVHDPERRAPTERHLRRMFHLTAAEARVASLIVEGYPVAEAAEELHISVHTVRTQLKSIFAKTGVSRQTDLIRIVTTGLGLLAVR